MQIRWLEYESRVNPETGEMFVYPSKYRKLQYCVLEPWDDPEMAPHGGGRYVWYDVPVEKHG